MFTPDLDINAIDSEGYTPLMLAALNNRTEAVSQLLDSGADLTLKNKTGETAWKMACYGDAVSALLAILKRIEDPEYFRAAVGEILFTATMSDSVKIIQMLLDGGTDPNTRNQDGETPLMWATYGNALRTARLLLDNGADANLEDPFGGTALTRVASSNFIELTTLLIKAGADLNKRETKTGRTALTWAVATNRKEITALLLSNGANPSVVDNQKNSALKLADKQASPEIQKMIREALSEYM